MSVLPLSLEVMKMYLGYEPNYYDYRLAEQDFRGNNNNRNSNTILKITYTVTMIRNSTNNKNTASWVAPLV